MSNSAVDNIVNRLRTEVLAGDFGVGALPCRDDMAQRYKTSSYIVSQAIKQLQDEGLLTLKKKRVFVSNTSWEAAHQAESMAIKQYKHTTQVSTPTIIPTPLGVQPFYVYTHSYPEGFLASSGQELSGIVFYVGKGTVERSPQIQRVDSHEREALWVFNPKSGVNWYTIDAIRQIWKQGKHVIKQIIFETSDESEALAFESQALKQFASPYLTNRRQNPFVSQRVSVSFKQ